MEIGIGRDDCPRGDRVENPQANDGNVEGNGHDFLGIDRLFGIVRSHFESDPGPECEEQSDAGGAAEQFAVRLEALESSDRIERRCRYRDAMTGMNEDAEIEEQQDEDFRDQGNA